MIATLGCGVEELHRSRFGDLDLGDLPIGGYITLPVNYFGGD
jgi:16S rRNA U516 pseudouridylate synthase RsuA-like enzyme